MIQKFVIRMVERLEKQEKKKSVYRKSNHRKPVPPRTRAAETQESGVDTPKQALWGAARPPSHPHPSPTPPPPPCSRCCFRGCLIAAAASPSPNWRPRWEESHFSPLPRLQDPSEAACNEKPGDKGPRESRVGRILALNHPELCTEQQLS